mmetsp:Transcript_73442/g.238875  ORF Transcript_73442/g.238875 Transcript_73442/m.238875 type:complete len:342 (-) Transcript_73442:2141-3166(-)
MLLLPARHIALHVNAREEHGQRARNRWQLGEHGRADRRMEREFILLISEASKVAQAGSTGLPMEQEERQRSAAGVGGILGKLFRHIPVETRQGDGVAALGGKSPQVLRPPGDLSGLVKTAGKQRSLCGLLQKQARAERGAAALPPEQIEHEPRVARLTPRLSDGVDLSLEAHEVHADALQCVPGRLLGGHQRLDALHVVHLHGAQHAHVEHPSGSSARLLHVEARTLRLVMQSQHQVPVAADVIEEEEDRNKRRQLVQYGEHHTCLPRVLHLQARRCDRTVNNPAQATLQDVRASGFQLVDIAGVADARGTHFKHLLRSGQLQNAVKKAVDVQHFLGLLHG